MYYKLIRSSVGHHHLMEDTSPPLAVRGDLYRVSHYFNKRTGITIERLTHICCTIEQAEHLILPLIYEVGVTRSERYQRLLPVLRQVPSESDVRIVADYNAPDKAPIFVHHEDEKIITTIWLNEQQRGEEIRLEITTIQ